MMIKTTFDNRICLILFTLECTLFTNKTRLTGINPKCFHFEIVGLTSSMNDICNHINNAKEKRT